MHEKALLRTVLNLHWRFFAKKRDTFSTAHAWNAAASDADSTIAFARETTTGGFCWVFFAHPFKRRADDGDDDTDVWTLGEVGWN